MHFLLEASVMKQFNSAFIVKLYGVVSEGIPAFLVMELMEKGNLRDFLRAHRPNSEENLTNASMPSKLSYFKWAFQIADGMAYLESQKFVHRDLAARNCMVSNDETVKIGDFGMARDIYYHEYYKPLGCRLLPIRWLAPENLKDGKFTVKSDVWSYGIVLYEMVTLGQQPYAGLRNDQSKIFQNSFATKNFENIEKTNYNFSINENEEIRKHTLLEELDKITEFEGDSNNFNKIDEISTFMNDNGDENNILLDND
uniref:receptor protein-tyrosine kinase n=1 Tax=Panagrolaimus superbus TaxID=310955 RepID=A0A914XU71_9BILA